MSTVPPPQMQQPDPAYQPPAYGMPPQYPTGAPAPKPKNGLGITSIVLGAVGLVFAFIPFVGIVGGFLAFVGLVLGIIAIFLKNRSRISAIVGSAISFVALILAIVMGLVYTAVFVAAVDDASTVDPPSVVQEAEDGAAHDDPAEGADQALGTLEHPAAFGSTVVVSTYAGEVWEVTVGQPDLDFTADVMAASPINQEPAPGNVYAMVPVTVKYVGDDSGRPFELQFQFVSATGQAFDGSFVMMDGQLSDVDELLPGAVGTGNVIIEIPADGAAQGLWSVKYLLGDSAIFFGAPS